ncbi:MAG: protein kinase [Lentisphaerae bacterium]|nr:protein kinase [Lentisphaerota bacterium]
MLDAKLDAHDFAGTVVSITNEGETRKYELLKRAGSGKKAVTWRAKAVMGVEFAVKFVAQSEYDNHSIHSEISRARRLPRRRFAQTYFFGTPVFADSEDASLVVDTYAIVVEWVEGISLKQFVRENRPALNVDQMLSISRDLCEALAFMSAEGLSHSDLHDENVMITTELRGPGLTRELDIRIIDTGSLMSIGRKEELLQRWDLHLQALRGQTSAGGPSPEEERLAGLIDWFSRTDQEWVVSHLCDLVNVVKQNAARVSPSEQRFAEEAGPVLARMVDQDVSMRVDSPDRMHSDLVLLWARVRTPSGAAMTTPFDLISAELIRSPVLLNRLFSEKCPWYEQCATTDPIYIYGPRGCGKSTILRRLSLLATMESADPTKAFNGRPFIGVYLSCSSELRSRFWLFSAEDYAAIQSDAIFFFSLLLVEALVRTLDLLRDGTVETKLGASAGLTPDIARQICGAVCSRVGIPAPPPKLQGLSWLSYTQKLLAAKRHEVWKRILTTPSDDSPDPSVIFDICSELPEIFPLLQDKHIAFLIDDYSNQRIPIHLQRALNQTISFAKQGNPIFKVSSEYHGVDLEGIQEGREVVEVNLGKEYVELADRNRSVFLEDVLNIRFRESGVEMDAEKLLGRSNVGPGLDMARAIRDEANDGGTVRYHGIDTIADICSGDIAMALDLVKTIFASVEENLPLKEPVSAARQHDIIHQYSDREHMYLRYNATFGKEIAEIADALCKLAHDAAATRTSNKDGRDEPMIKTHCDIKTRAVSSLHEDLRALLMEMERKGVLFSLDTSRSRLAGDGTERYQVRRILLVKYVAPMGRRDSIKLDTKQKLVYLLTDPREFAQEELTGQGHLRI